MHIGALLDVNSLQETTGLASGVNLMKSMSTGNKAQEARGIHSGFETPDRRRQKTQIWGTSSSKKGLMSSKRYKKYNRKILYSPIISQITLQLPERASLNSLISVTKCSVVVKRI